MSEIPAQRSPLSAVEGRASSIQMNCVVARAKSAARTPQARESGHELGTVTMTTFLRDTMIVEIPSTRP